MLLLEPLAPLRGSARADSDLTCPDYVASHAPLLWLHSDDPFKPSDLLAHIHHTTPKLKDKSLKDAEGLPSLDLDNLDVLNKWGDNVALTSNDDPLSLPDWIRGEAPDEDGRIRNSTACVVILVDKDEPEVVDAFYFYFYSYNEGPNITQVLEPANTWVKAKEVASGMHFGNHVGDWENNMIRFRDGKPVGIFYSQHVDGRAFEWDDPEISKLDGRPIVYSARGSHANYPASGKQIHNLVLYDNCDEGQRWDPILSAYFYRFDPATSTLTPLTPPNQTSPPPPSTNLTSFFYFSGRWGDWQYPNSDPRQRTIPKFDLKRFETGPTGPIHKPLIRKGLMPDGKREVSWMEWGVRTYLMFYPCCLRGWRFWVSMAVIVTVLVGGAAGVVLGIRRFRRRAYRRLQTEETEDIAMEELFSSSDEED
ncbi:hypothetical protein ACJ41O_001474 [Fusarium nematophilum]